MGGTADEEARERTEGYVDRTLRRDPKTKFILQKMEEIGCSVDASKFVTVEHCDASIAGGFRPQSGVVVCQNHVQTQEEVDNLLAHELIHATVGLACGHKGPFRKCALAIGLEGSERRSVVGSGDFERAAKELTRALHAERIDALSGHLVLVHCLAGNW